MEDVTHHTQHAIGTQLGNRQPATSPDDRIVSQTAQQHEHLLGFEALFVARGAAQALLVVLEARFRCPHLVGRRTSHRPTALPVDRRVATEAARSDEARHLPRQSRSGPRPPIAHPACGSERQCVAPNAHRQMARLRHPACLPFGGMGIVGPHQHALGQAAGMSARVVFGMNVVATGE